MDVGAILFNKIQELTTEVNTQLLQRPIANGTVARELAWIRSGVKSGKTIFPVRFWSNKTKKRNPFEEVGHTPIEVVNFSHMIEEWAPDGETVPRGTQVQDLYGVFESGLPQILESSANEMEYQLAHLMGNGQSTTPVESEEGLLAGGPTDYDALPFFSDSKLVNPNRRGIGTFSNFNSGLNLDRAGLLAAFQQLDGVKGPNGRVMRMPGPIVVVVSNEDQFDRADTLLNGRIRATPVGAAAATESNSTASGQDNGEGGGLMGRARVIKHPELVNFDGGKGWYAYKIATATHRPFMLGIAEPPQIYIEGLSGNEHSRVTRNLIRYGVRGFWGWGYAFPQLAYKAIEK